MSSHGRQIASVITDLRKYARTIPAIIQRETGITPSLLLSAAEYLAQRYMSEESLPHMMCGRCKSDYPCICDEPLVYQRVIEHRCPFVSDSRYRCGKAANHEGAHSYEKVSTAEIFRASDSPRSQLPAPGSPKCIYSDCDATQDLQVSHVCLKHILRDEEAHDCALASAFFHVLCTLESYKYTDWEFVDDDADEEDPQRKRAEATTALIEVIIHDVKTLAKARGVKPAPDEKENG